MKLSITAIENAAWETPLVLRGNFIDSIHRASEMGYQGIELHVADSGRLDRDAIEEALQINRISLSAIGTGPSYSQEGICFTHRDEGVRKEAIRRMKNHIRFASETDAVVIIGLIKGMRSNCSNADTYFKYFREGMDICIREAQNFQVTLVLEIIDRFESDWLNTIEEGVHLLEEFPDEHVRLHIDTFHMNIEEKDPAESILKAGNCIGYVHIADSDRWYPGHAHYDFASTMNALNTIGYKGYISLESFPYPEQVIAAKECRKFINKLYK